MDHILIPLINTLAFCNLSASVIFFFLAQEENYRSVFMALDKFFLTVFIMEILIKWYHDFFGFWKVNWNIFDFIIVAASLLGPSKWIFISSIY